MADKAAQELRNLLAREREGGRQATRGIVNASSTTRPDSSAKDMISSLMGTLNTDLGTPLQRNIPQQTQPARGYQNDEATKSVRVPRDPTQMRPAIVTSKSYLPAQAQLTDKADFTVIKFGTECLLRGNIGRYMTATPVYSDPQAAAAAANSLNLSTSNATVISSKAITSTATGVGQSGVTYSLGVKGLGVSDPLDCITFLNVEHREDQGNIRYGMTIAIRAPAAKERLLSLRESSKLGFHRNLIGQGEKWVILKAHTPGAGSAQRSSSCEDVDARGDFVRVGDLILLQTASSDQLLAVHESAAGTESRLVPKGSGGLGLSGEIWQLELFLAQPLPTWLNRPYLSGKFLLMTPSERSQASDTEARTFPGSIAQSIGRSPNVTSSILAAGSSASPAPPLLSEFPSTVQHLILLRELLLAFSGIEGQYIRLAAQQPTTATVSASGDIGGPPTSSSSKPKLKDVTLLIDLDTAERSAANQIAVLLPICENAIRVREFIKFHSRYEFGLVSHAVVSVMKSVMREFDILIAQLEHLLVSNKLTLQKMTYLLQPAKATLSSLVMLTKKLRDLSGGQLIDRLYSCLLDQGDSKARELHAHMLQKASEPFLRTLSNWVFRGELSDPYKEFLIQEDTSITKEALQDDFNAQYWESRYRLRESHVPKQFRDLTHRSLVAGKYLNVIRECVENLHSSKSESDDRSWLTTLQLPEYQDLRLDANSGVSSITKLVDQAYALSSRALLRLLQEGHNISSHFRSLRRFFLLEHGDFFTQFMDTAEEELRRDVKDITLSRVQNLLALAIQTSTLSLDTNREDISCSLASHNLIQHLHLIQSAGENTTESYLSTMSQGLKGVEALTMDYRVGWPVSIVLSRRAITKYQLLSRLLYFSKHVERRVLSCWQDHQSTKNLNVRGELGTPYCLRHRMLHFLQNFVYYMTVEVISPRSHELAAGMAEAQDIDEVLVLHERFLDTCLKECLLASQDLLKILTKLMTTCLLFADNLKKFATESEVVDTALSKETPTAAALSGASSAAVEAILARRKLVQSARQQTRTQYIQRETSHEWFSKMITKFSQTFDAQLKEFLDKLWGESYRQHPQLSNLCVRIDYNGYYSTLFAGAGGVGGALDPSNLAASR